MPTPEYHAKKSPSSAHRWIHCPASIKLSAGIPTTTSQYAEAGRLAHSIAELKARKRFLVLNKRTYNAQLKKLQADEHYAPEMDGYTDLYVETLEQHAMTFQSAPFIALETSVPIGLFTSENKEDGTPATGTADCIQIAESVLWVTDYKNGAGVPVEADHNPQMMTYALGALSMYALIYGDSIQTIRLTIVQPALKSVSDWEISRGALEEWGHDILTPAAVRADSEDPGDPFPGDWCRFCPIKNQCRERANKVLAVEAFGKKLPPLLSDAEVGQALQQADGLVSWYNDLKEYALQSCLAGKQIAGFKAVEGKKSRDWDNLDTAFADLQQHGVAEALLWERKPATVAGLEKAIGKKTFAEVSAGHVTVSPGKPTLVPESDKRPEFNAAAQAFNPIN
ncbi:hypothetical protein OBV_43190 [Oscillibacter valericigenes Sjm18-20]|nr:hypothetical protein OBV_01860 [Oscillibacter valericigenes Sjm18-20]BAL01518.1 hypothetical protein OBV_43190 [Oscillibacter valericigenes Sjm18-20]